MIKSYLLVEPNSSRQHPQGQIHLLDYVPLTPYGPYYYYYNYKAELMLQFQEESLLRMSIVLDCKNDYYCFQLRKRLVLDGYSNTSCLYYYVDVPLWVLSKIMMIRWNTLLVADNYVCIVLSMTKTTAVVGTLLLCSYETGNEPKNDSSQYTLQMQKVRFQERKARYNWIVRIWSCNLDLRIQILCYLQGILLLFSKGFLHRIQI